VANNVSRKRLMREIMEVDFVLKELNLFLDTHPCHTAALEKFQRYEARAVELKCQYEKMFGPLTPSVNDNLTSWEWTESPWPWENCQ